MLIKVLEEVVYREESFRREGDWIILECCSYIMLDYIGLHWIILDYIGLLHWIIIYIIYIIYIYLFISFYIICHCYL